LTLKSPIFIDKNAAIKLVSQAFHAG